MKIAHTIQFIACLFLILMANETQAQQILPINLETVLELAGANNLTIREFQTKQALAEADLATAKSWWLPEAYAGAHTHQLWGAAMNADGRFFLDVNRQSLWAGVGLNASWNFGEGIYRTKAAKLQAQAATVLDAAWTAGVRYLDAARSYGRAEAFLAHWLHQRPAAR